MVELLLGEKSIDVNRPNSDGTTVLHVAACKKENIQMFELILADERVDVNLQQNHGGNVLTLAVVANNVKAAELIVPIPELEDGSPDWRVVQQVGFFCLELFSIYL